MVGVVSRGLAVALALGLCVMAWSAARADPPTSWAFARAAAISDVSLSPDGQRIVALTSPDGDQLTISIWKTAAPGEKPYVIGATHMRFLDVRFLKNDRLLVIAVQPITAVGDASGTEGVVNRHVVKAYVTDLEGKNWSPLLPEGSNIGKSEETVYEDAQGGAQLVDALSRDPQNVIVFDQRAESFGDVDKVNIYTGQVTRLEQGSEKFFGYMADLKGDIRAKQEVDFKDGNIYIAQWIRNPDTGKWEEHFRSYAKDREITEVVAFTDDPNVVIVSTPNGGDKTAFWTYDIRQHKLIEQEFGHKLFDVGSDIFEPRVIQSRDASDYGAILGFTLLDQGYDRYWDDPQMRQISDGVAKALGVQTTQVNWVDPGTGLKAPISVPAGASVDLVSWSDDRKEMIVEKSGPTDPGEYYLLTDGTKLSELGKARAWIDPTQLGQTQLVEYPARDGLMIPAYLTLPPAAFGKGPFPTLIEPHGGPWARDLMEWDEAGWIQYFASRGFAVLQPQFRGSEGWGQKLWRAGDREWGQKMQDDKDDGVKWLIAQHIADPSRVAMFGYSYGGYAALAASIRPNGLYQCAISGAGAGDLSVIARATFDNRFERAFQNPTIDGLDALKHAAEAQIPVLLYHGDRDQTVDIDQSRQFAARLKAAGKPVKLVEIKDMGHQYIFMTPEMMQQQLDIIDAFLKDGCKPGGL